MSLHDQLKQLYEYDFLDEVVSNLALFAELHPTPYKLVWLNTQTDIHVSQ